MLPDISTAKDLAAKTPNFPAGFQGRVKIHLLKELNGFKGHAFVCEVIVETSNLPVVNVGEIRSWYVSMATPRLTEFALPNLKQFALAALGAKTEAQKEAVKGSLSALLNEAVGEKQPMKGTSVFLMTQNNEAGTFTKHSWAAI
jgi:hypothetical protein